MTENTIKRSFARCRKGYEKNQEKKETAQVRFSLPVSIHCLSLCALGTLSTHYSQWRAGQYSHQHTKSFYVPILDI